MRDIALAISGMSCHHCLNAVNKALAAVPDIEVRTVRMGRAELRIPDHPGADAPARAAVESAGYKVEGIIAL